VTVEPNSIPGFVAELFRAANEIEKLGTEERQRLLERASHTIGDLRAAMIRAGRVLELERTDPTFRLRAISLQAKDIPSSRIAAELLGAAQEIRTLKIKLEQPTEGSA
jgi:hypothetical protein